jgi:hypothetical protein
MFLSFLRQRDELMPDRDAKAIKIEHGIPRKIILPSEGETVAIATNSKTAALCYDRVLVPDLPPPMVDKDIPDAIRCCGESLLEINFQTMTDGTMELKKKTLSSDDYHEYLTSILGPIFAAISGKALDTDNAIRVCNGLISNPKQYVSNMIRSMAKSFSEKYGIPIAVVCASEKERDTLYKEGEREVVATVLSNLEIVDEKKLTWQQVMDFRKDKISLQKYRRLLHWLDKEMIGKSQAFIEDDIAQKLVDYESTLKKHGLKTVLGTIEEVLDGKYLLGASGVVGSFSIAGYAGLGVLAGTGLIVGKMAVKLGNTWLDFDDAERGANSEISWVYEVKKQAGR